MVTDPTGTASAVRAWSSPVIRVAYRPSPGIRRAMRSLSRLLPRGAWTAGSSWQFLRIRERSLAAPGERMIAPFSTEKHDDNE